METPEPRAVPLQAPGGCRHTPCLGLPVHWEDFLGRGGFRGHLTCPFGPSPLEEEAATCARFLPHLSSPCPLRLSAPPSPTSSGPWRPVAESPGLAGMKGGGLLPRGVWSPSPAAPRAPLHLFTHPVVLGLPPGSGLWHHSWGSRTQVTRDRTYISHVQAQHGTRCTESPAPSLHFVGDHARGCMSSCAGWTVLLQLSLPLCSHTFWGCFCATPTGAWKVLPALVLRAQPASPTATVVAWPVQGHLGRAVSGGL